MGHFGAIFITEIDETKRGFVEYDCQCVAVFVSEAHVFFDDK